MSILVGGGAADVDDVVSRVWSDFPRTAAFIVVTTFIVLFVLLRSMVLPVKALVMNTLSIVASFGALVWIFQDGNLSSVLGFQPLGFVETTQPVILFCVLFGLSMDYEVFLLSRMKEAWERTGDNTEAVAAGLERSGRIVSSAALVVVVVAGSFAFGDIVLIKALGPRRGDRRGARCDRRPGAARPRDDAPARALELVGAGAARPRVRGILPRPRPRPRRRPDEATPSLVLAIALVVAACGGPVLANPPAARPVVTPAPASSARPADPQPIVLPRDDGPHDRLTEWWYVTGHLRTADGHRFGFEDVVFRAERGGFPVSWASHLALTDETGGQFHYAQRSEVGPQVDHSPRDAAGAPTGYDLHVAGLDPATLAPPTGDALVHGRRGRHATRSRRRPRASEVAGRPGRRFGLDLRLDADAPPALHEGDGYIDFGPAGGSYYYSRTRMTATGTVTLGGERSQVDRRGMVRPPVGRLHLRRRRRLGLVRRQPRRRHGRHALARPRRGRLLPAGLRHRRRPVGDDAPPRPGRVHRRRRAAGPARRPGRPTRRPGRSRSRARSSDRARPTVAQQELDTRASTGVIYWEGSQVVTATRDGVALGGEAYVELTGYAGAR